MIYFAGTPVPKDWYEVKYDCIRHPKFTFEFIKNCVVEKAHGIVFIQPIDQKEGDVLEVSGIDHAVISFPSCIVQSGDLDEIIKNYIK